MKNNERKIFEKYKDCAYIIISHKFSNNFELVIEKDLELKETLVEKVLFNPVFKKDINQKNFSFNYSDIKINRPFDCINYLNNYGFWGLKGNSQALSSFRIHKNNFESLLKKFEQSSDSKIKICIPCFILQKKLTGIARQVKIALESITKNEKFETVYIVCSNPSRIKNILDTSQLKKIKFITLFSLNKYKFDILWLPYFDINPLLIWLLERKSNTILLTIHDYIAYDIKNYHINFYSWTYYRLLVNHFISISDLIYCVSESIYLRSKISYPNKNITWINPGVDHFSKIYSEEKKVEYKHKNKYIFVLGTNYAHKNIEFAHRVWQSLAKKHQKIDIIYCGLRCEELQKELVEKGFKVLLGDSSAKFIPHQEEKIVIDLIKNSAFVLYPTFSEGFGLIPYESAYYSSPCIFTSFGPLRELGEYIGAPKDWRLESYLEIGNKILSSNKFRKEYISKTLEFSANITWENYMTKFYRLTNKHLIKRLKFNSSSISSNFIILILYIPFELCRFFNKILIRVKSILMKISTKTKI